ncbi:hypothetical protein C7435_1648 [Maricaulis maris]|uniref:17 kDa surface antigen n=1 Tax=Maricaulis maris TaxID=74318 RepID=A0A495DDT9_9PROT|nr:hypothetical protein C7435_1648 [Maricaulis maris]
MLADFGGTMIMGRSIFGGLLACALALQGCATTSGGGGTAMDRAIRNCMLAVGAGALLGAVVGNNTGSGRAGRGATTGALIGAGACTLLVAVANEQDRARMRELELAAIQSNSAQRGNFVGPRGEGISYSVAPSPAPVPAPTAEAASYTACRYSQQTLSVQGRPAASIDPQLWCRLETGDWEAVTN